MLWSLCLLVCPCAEPLRAGTHERAIEVGDAMRTFLVHVPPQYDARKPTPLVLCFHGALTSGRVNTWFTGLNRKADDAGFIVVHPDGEFMTWNSGGFPPEFQRRRGDDVAFTRALLDDLATIVNVDPKRVFATGMSNGAMMCHRLGVELSDRIAAIAPVAGTLCVDQPQAKRPIPVLQIHGTQDTLVPWDGKGRPGTPFCFRSVPATIEFWTTHNRCAAQPLEEKQPDKSADGTTVTRFTYADNGNGAEVVLVKIDGGGHTWPGRDLKLKVLGRTTLDIDANDLIWDFFKRHPLP